MAYSWTLKKGKAHLHAHKCFKYAHETSNSWLYGLQQCCWNPSLGSNTGVAAATTNTATVSRVLAQLLCYFEDCLESPQEHCTNAFFWAAMIISDIIEQSYVSTKQRVAKLQWPLLGMNCCFKESPCSKCLEKYLERTHAIACSNLKENNLLNL